MNKVSTDDFFAGRRVVVTGGGGFIGSHLVRRLVVLGARVAVIDALRKEGGGKSENLAEVAENIDFFCTDLCNATAYWEVLRDSEMVFSLAGATGHVDSMHRPQVDLDDNCRATLNLLEALRRTSKSARIVAISTRQVYGRPIVLPVDESHPLQPVDVNGIHMQAVENYYRLYHEVYDLRSACLRLTNTYGPRMNLQASGRGFLAEFVLRALSGIPIELYGDGSQLRDLNYVDDVVDAILRVAKLPMKSHEVYNLGHDRPRSLGELAETLARFTNVPILRRPFPAERAKIDIGDYWGSYAKVQRATGWQPVVDDFEGFRRTLEYYRRHSAENADTVPPATLKRHADPESTASFTASDAMERTP